MLKPFVLCIVISTAASTIVIGGYGGVWGGPGWGGSGWGGWGGPGLTGIGSIGVGGFGMRKTLTGGYGRGLGTALDYCIRWPHLCLHPF